MKIESTALIAVERGIGQMMKPIPYADTLIDLRSKRDIADHLEDTSHLLVVEAVNGEECDSCPDL